MWCAAFSRNTIAPKYSNCLDAPSSQHNDSTATGPGLERGPNALKCRDTLSTEVKEAASRDCPERAVQAAVCLFPVLLLFCLILPVKPGEEEGRRKRGGRGPEEGIEGWGATEDQAASVMTMRWRTGLRRKGKVAGDLLRRTDELEKEAGQDFNVLCSRLCPVGMLRTSRQDPGLLRIGDEDGQFSCQCRVPDCLFLALHSLK